MTCLAEQLRTRASIWRLLAAAARNEHAALLEMERPAWEVNHAEAVACNASRLADELETKAHLHELAGASGPSGASGRVRSG